MPQMLLNYPDLVRGLDFKDVFRSRIAEVYALALANSRDLVIRDYSHFDFLNKKSRTPLLREVLGQDYNVISLCTVRKPD